jgi:hypothetical protein
LLIEHYCNLSNKCSRATLGCNRRTKNECHKSNYNYSSGSRKSVNGGSSGGSSGGGSSSRLMLGVMGRIGIGIVIALGVIKVTIGVKLCF